MRRLLALVLLAATCWVAPSAEAAYVPSCNDGVVMPQLCTLATAVATSSFGPRDTGILTGSTFPAHLVQHRPAGCSGPAIPPQEFGTSIAGRLRGYQVLGGTMLQLGGCLDGPTTLDSETDLRGSAPLGDGWQRLFSRQLHVIISRATLRAPARSPA